MTAHLLVYVCRKGFDMNRHPRRRLAVVSSAVLAVLLVGIVVAVQMSDGSSPASAKNTVLLNGAGSTFDAPLFKAAFADYANQQPNLKIDYKAVGSGAGMTEFTAKSTDFGATDVPMTDAQLAAAGGPDSVVQIPVTLGPVAIAYNLPSVHEQIKLDGETLAAIYLGTIKTWNDPKIAALNPGVTLPALNVSPIHRGDGSGTTAIVSSYLSSASPTWQTIIGAGTKLVWPGGLGAKGSDGVLGQVQILEGAIGYAELSYLTGTKLATALIANQAGAFVAPTPAGATACAAAVADQLPADLRLMIAGCAGSDPTIYPISGFSWIVVSANQLDPAKGKALGELLSWLIHDGQKVGVGIGYAPLPDLVVAKADTSLKSLDGADSTAPSS
jgi:phosphate transport system substrate-binding protein